MKTSFTLRLTFGVVCFAAMLPFHWAWAQNVGIGTDSPTQKLDVDGGLRARGLSGTGIGVALIDASGVVLRANGSAVGQILTWNGTSWVAAAPATNGTVTSIATNEGLQGGTITTTGTIGIADLGVSTAKLADQSVTTAKMAPGAANQMMRTNAAGTSVEWFTPNFPTGSGTVDYLARWTPTGTQLGIGATRDDGTNVGIGAAPNASFRLNVNGYLRIEQGASFGCVSCGSTTDLFGSSNWGLLTVQGRVISTNNNLHLSPPGGARVILNTVYRAAGGTTGNTGLDIESTGAVFRVDNTAHFQARNAVGTYETYLWPRWSDDIMYLNYGAGGMHIRNNASASTLFMTNTNNVGIGTVTPGYRLTVQGGKAAFSRDGVYECCGGDATLVLGEQTNVTGRVASISFHNAGVAEGEMELANGGFRRIYFHDHQSTGLGIEATGLIQANVGVRTRKSYRYFQDFGYCNCSNGWDQSRTYDLGQWDVCAVAHFGFKNNQSISDEDDDAQCAVYPLGQGGSGEQTYYNNYYSHGPNSRQTWYMYFEAFEDTNGITCAATCWNLE